ncbi:MAG: potassium channel family protein [archaeon]
MKESFTKKFMRFYQEASYKKLIVIWISIIIVFAVLYYFLTSYSVESRLDYRGEYVEKGWHGLLNSVYFSFITTTTLGYGDIAPLGLSKVLAILEVIIGITMNGIIIAKLVSTKEEVILEELYDLTFTEKIDRLRANLYYDRVNISSFIQKIEANKIDKINDEGIDILYLNLESHLLDLKDFLQKQTSESDFLKKIDTYKTRLILKSIEIVFERYCRLKDLICGEKFSYAGLCRDTHLDPIRHNTQKIIDILKINQDKKVEEGIHKINLMLKNL